MSHADNSRYLAAAAAARSAATCAKASAALDRLEADPGGPALTMQQIAREAGISRAWLYSCDGLRRRAEAIRHSRVSTRVATPPTAQPGSDASLRVRLDMARRSQELLRAENEVLRRQLAHALGQLRAAARGSGYNDPSVAKTPPPAP